MACFARADTPNPPIRADWWPEGETVTLRPRLDWGIESEAQKRAVRLPPGLDMQSLSSEQAMQIIQQNMDAMAVQQYKFEAMLLEWTLAVDDGSLAPLSPEMIAQLPKAYADWIAAEIEKRGGALSADQRRGPEGDPTTPRSNSRSEESSSIVLAHSSGEKSPKRGS